KKAEERIDVTTYDSEQARVWGHIAERLLNVYVKKEKMGIKYLPVFWVTDVVCQTSAVSAFFYHVKYNLSFFLQRI
ncbi:MAG: DUF4422 domain-containing protein, partial [Prevotellaceae bacterium]|nr:DUF4422 domain-containing protein [Prevotellaceae bacterium]